MITRFTPSLCCVAGDTLICINRARRKYCRAEKRRRRAAPPERCELSNDVRSARALIGGGDIIEQSSRFQWTPISINGKPYISVALRMGKGKGARGGADNARLFAQIALMCLLRQQLALTSLGSMRIKCGRLGAGTKTRNRYSHKRSIYFVHGRHSKAGKPWQKETENSIVSIAPITNASRVARFPVRIFIDSGLQIIIMICVIRTNIFSPISVSFPFSRTKFN